ncbi:MAG: hypothetical protein JWM72_3386 [Actinomycetia bacterium]|nr:hypothetical protein [Actinomycetes bacterium]MDQ1459075.1 hypothetical protein [Actinomycetota bacterium]
MRLAPRYDGPVIISIDGPADDVLAAVSRQRRRLEATLADLGPGEWSSASRCDGWTVQDVVAHIVGVNTFWQASVTAGLAGTPTHVLTGFDPAATPPLMVDSMRALTPAEVLDQYVSSNDGFLGAIADLDGPALSTLAESPAGLLPIRLLAHHALWDCWVHERDITLPLSLAQPMEPDEVLSCLRFAAALSPAFALHSATAPKGMFSVMASDPESCFTLDVNDSVSVRQGSTAAEAPCLRGDAVQLIEALSLRVPLPVSTPLEWRQLLGGLATVFDTEVDGN